MSPLVIVLLALAALLIIALPITWNAAIAKKTKADAEKNG